MDESYASESLRCARGAGQPYPRVPPRVQAIDTLSLVC